MGCDQTSRIIALASLVVACAALFLTILKPGKAKVSVLLRKDAVTTGEGYSSSTGSSLSVVLRIPILVRNTGAGGAGIGEFECYVKPSGIANVYRSDSFRPLSDLYSLRPYEWIAGEVSLSIDFTKDGDLNAFLHEEELVLRLEYRTLDGRGAHDTVKTYDLMPVLRQNRSKIDAALSKIKDE